jgi:Short-chain alcohol dehydrogenase of unknown specificity
MTCLADQTVILTGAGSGIGKGFARALAREGAILFLAGRNVANLEATAEEVRALGAIAHVVPTDVTKEDQVAALFQKALDITGKIDIVINNAGVFDGGPIDELSLETWNHVVGVNLTGPFLGTREAMRIMKQQRRGRIVNIGSISAQMPRLNSVPYTTTKHALVGLTKAAALEGRDYGVVVSCLHPGNVLTERRASSDAPADQEPMMTPDELAETLITMVTLPPHVNMLEAIVLPVEQKYLGRG